jgi:DNA-directed RNA polymerase specialized sigma subunit
MTGHLKISRHQPKPLLVVVTDTPTAPHPDFKSTTSQQPVLNSSDIKDKHGVTQVKFSKTLLSPQNQNQTHLMREFLKHGRNSSDVVLENGGIDGTKVRLLIQNLPAKYRKVIHLRYSKELSLKEIALITGQTQNAVAVQAHRGIAKLKTLYFDT